MAKVYASTWKDRHEVGGYSVLTLCILLIVIRFFFTGIMGLMPQDAYYYFYGQHLALSYFDHPPMIAYLLRFATSLFGKKVIVLKMADATVTLCTLLAFYHLAKKFLSKSKALLAAALLSSTILLSILSLVSTPDVPLMLCWTLSLHFLYEAIFNHKKINWIWSGIFCGLSFDSKYTAVFLIIGLVGFLIIAKPYRKYLFSRWLLLFLLFFTLTLLPVLIWNASNGFASFKYQSAGRAQEGIHLDVHGFLGVIGHQSAILLPFLFISLVYSIYKILKKYGFRFGRIPSDQLFLLCFFVPLFAGFFFLSFFYWVKLNWIMPAYLSGVIWVARYWRVRWLRYQLFLSIAVHLILALEIHYYFFPVNSDDTWFGWPDLAHQVDSVQQQYPKAFIFSTDDYKTSAILNFYLNEMVYAKNIVGEKALQFDYIGSDLQVLKGRDALFIDSNPHFQNLESEWQSLPKSYYTWFDRITPLDPILIKNRGRVVRKFSVFLCRNYHAR